MEGKCRTCLYRSARTDTCDYILIVGHSRGCPVKGCTKYVATENAKRLCDYYAGVRDLPESDKELLDLYEQGFTDSEIGQLTGKGRMVIAHWRQKMGLRSQKELEMACRDG